MNEASFECGYLFIESLTGVLIESAAEPTKMETVSTATANFAVLEATDVIASDRLSSMIFIISPLLLANTELSGCYINSNCS